MDYFICSNKNSNRKNCKNKQIRADFIEDAIKKQLQKEIKQIEYSKEELKKIFKDSQIEIKKNIEKLENDLKRNRSELEFNNRILEEIYQDKVNRIISQEDFKRFYEKKNKEKINILNNIREIECEIKKSKEELKKVDINEILKETNKILSLKIITKEMYKKLIDRIEFDCEKNLYIKFRFEKII